MAKVSISAGARMAGISRSYLYRKYITPGVISTEKDSAGNSVIDTAEIIRIFGKIHGDSEQDTKSTQLNAPENHSNAVAIQAENQLLREQLASAADREKWMQAKIDQLADQLSTTTKLLEHKETVTTAKDAQIMRQEGKLNVFRKESIWRRLFSRDNEA